MLESTPRTAMGVEEFGLEVPRPRNSRRGDELIPATVSAASGGMVR